MKQWLDSSLTRNPIGNIKSSYTEYFRQKKPRRNQIFTDMKQTLEYEQLRLNLQRVLTKKGFGDVSNDDLSYDSIIRRRISITKGQVEKSREMLEDSHKPLLVTRLKRVAESKINKMMPSDLKENQ